MNSTDAGPTPWVTGPAGSADSAGRCLASSTLVIAAAPTWYWEAALTSWLIGPTRAITYIRKATIVPTLIFPDATWAAPVPSTARNANWIASSEVLPTTACHTSARSPARHARCAASCRRAPSRSSAPEAFTVRNAPNMRSSAVLIAPTASCVSRVARPILGKITLSMSTAPATTIRVTPNRTTSRSPISTSAVSAVSTPVTAETAALLTTARSSVVSTVARAIRSPGSLRSSAPMVSRSSRLIRLLRVFSTMLSAVRSSK